MRRRDNDRISRYGWHAIVLMSAAQMMSLLDRQILAILSQDIRTDLQHRRCRDGAALRHCLRAVLRAVLAAAGAAGGWLGADQAAGDLPCGLELFRRPCRLCVGLHPAGDFAAGRGHRRRGDAACGQFDPVRQPAQEPPRAGDGRAGRGPSAGARPVDGAGRDRRRMVGPALRWKAAHRSISRAGNSPSSSLRSPASRSPG